MPSRIILAETSILPGTSLWCNIGILWCGINSFHAEAKIPDKCWPTDSFVKNNGRKLFILIAAYDENKRKKERETKRKRSD